MISDLPLFVQNDLERLERLIADLQSQLVDQRAEIAQLRQDLNDERQRRRVLSARLDSGEMS